MKPLKPLRIKDRVKPKLPPVAPGVYMAVCVGVVDLGEQHNKFNNNYENRVKFIWALPSELVEIDGEQCERQLSKEFKFSFHKNSALRPFIENWNAKTYSDEEIGEFNVFDQIGKACQLQVSLNDTCEYANVTNLMPIPKGMPEPVAKTEQFGWNMDDWDDVLFESLPEWVQNQIKKSTQYQKEHAPETTIEVKAVPDPEEACPI